MRLFDPQRLASVLAQQNPVMSGLQGAQQTISTIYQPQQLQAQLQNQLLQNQMNRVKAQYAPQMAQYAAQQAQLLPQLTQKKIDYMPLTALTQAQNALARQKAVEQSQQRFGNQIYQIRAWMKSLPSQTIDAINQQYPGGIDALTKTLMTQAMGGAGIIPGQTQLPQQDYSSAIQDQLSKLGLVKQMPAQTMQPATKAVPGDVSNLQRNLAQMQKAGEQISQMQPSQQQDITQQQATVTQQASVPTDPLTKKPLTPFELSLQRASLIARNNKAISDQLRARFDASRAFDDWSRSPKVKKILMNASKYQGLWGKSKEYMDKTFHPGAYADMEAARAALGTLFPSGTSLIEGLTKSLGGLNKAEDPWKIAQSSLQYDPDATIRKLNDVFEITNDMHQSLAKNAQPFGDAYGIIGRKAVRLPLSTDRVNLKITAGPDKGKVFPTTEKHARQLLSKFDYVTRVN